MPAERLSPSAPVLDQLALAVTERAPRSASPAGLLAVFAQVTDPRKRRGRRHRLPVLLTLATCAVLAGARSFTAIAEWAADAGETVWSALGIVRVPDASTFRRVFTHLDADALDTALGAWAATATTPAPGQRRRIAVDGKTLRGSRAGDTPGRHLLTAFDQQHHVVLAQRAVDAKTNEIGELKTLLSAVELAGAVVTADALHTQRDTAAWLVDRGAHYVLVAKANQPGLSAQLAALPWTKVRTRARSHDRGHGRVETRVLKTTEVRAGIGFPHAVQAIQIIRRRAVAGRPADTQTVYAITSLPTHQASPALLADLARDHWSVENRLHWVRDVTYDEDRHRARTGNAPQIMASLRNLALAILRLTGTTNIAQALRHHARRPDRPLTTITNLNC
ncbi:ISAs1 family transposase [Frankia sp. AgKG'84/4]|uniref:ISAs1 family transposase n=1 Tax=Frankia sp. AgKG'84/4 TaxID=573490 RepID=UPI00200D0290|nr:ISAs1 family transposase [Frankia sp. AgKG'84/4]MCL9796129.1 ISAs1 family transposase [Frankia sp. AgKG'84/4]